MPRLLLDFNQRDQLHALNSQLQLHAFEMGRPEEGVLLALLERELHRVQVSLDTCVPAFQANWRTLVDEHDLARSHDCARLTRFTPNEVSRVVGVLYGGPDVVLPAGDGAITSSLHGFLIMTTRFHSAAAASDLCHQVGVARRDFSRVASAMAADLCHRIGQLLTNTSMWGDLLPTMADASDSAGSFVPSVVGYVDGTAVMTERPGTGLMQEAMYNGYYGGRWRRLCMSLVTLFT